MTESPPEPLLEARNVSKAFPGVQALAEVSLQIRPGEILCLVGENGAGKSTLMKIVAGIYQPDAGELFWQGRPLALTEVADAQRQGIVLIHQELNLAESLDVASNLFLGREPLAGGPLRLIRPRVYADAAALMRRVGLNVSPRTPVARLSIGQQQLVEIARALCWDLRLLIMDEPTSSLTQQETERLFEVIADLKRQGVSVLYISHRLKEVEHLADRVVVLRDGRNAGELTRAEVNHTALVGRMVGRELKQFFHRQHGPQSEGPPALDVSGWRREAHLPAVDFQIRPGEIVGLAGLMGAGRTELAESLLGLRPHAAGSVAVGGRTAAIDNVQSALAAGIFLVPEDRRLQGLILSDSIRRNISLPSLKRLSRWGLVQRGAEARLAAQLIERLGVRTTDSRKIVGQLSGGNQQKVVLAKWLARELKVLILDEPTRGVDVGAKAEIYALMDQLSAQGVGILMISSDLEEILGVSDRVLVMHEHALAGALLRAECSEQQIMHLATGGKRVA